MLLCENLPGFRFPEKRSRLYIQKKCLSLSEIILAVCNDMFYFAWQACA